MPDFPRATTESTLKEWRHGQVEAERLSAAILHLDGFEDIDPQAPLGGPDGRKDILCAKGKTLYVAAAYFPNAEKSFREVKDKFEHDLEGAVQHNREGFVFITSQAIGLSDREALEGSAAAHGKICILYHRERIRALLDSPTGYGVRLEHLQIPMNESEQFAYFASSGNRLEYALERHSREIRNLARRIDTLNAGQSFAVDTMARIADVLGADVGKPPRHTDTTSSDRLESEGGLAPLTASISPALLLGFHRLVCDDLPLSMVGKFRQTTVWIGAPGSTAETAEYVPPPPDGILPRLNEILSRWNERFAEVAGAAENAKISALAHFHSALVSVHPFTDGNGRVARALLIQQCIDLLDHADPALLDRGADYYRAVQQSRNGNFEQLEALIRRAVMQ